MGPKEVMTPILEDSPYDPGPCQRCGKRSEIVLKIGEHVVKGEVVYAPDRRLCLECCEIEKRELWEKAEG